MFASYRYPVAKSVGVSFSVSLPFFKPPWVVTSKCCVKKRPKHERKKSITCLFNSLGITCCFSRTWRGDRLMFEQIIRKAGEWERKICTCSQCYSDKKPLIFPPLAQRLIFLSESPYNFPRDECRNLTEFIQKDLYGSIYKRAKEIKRDLNLNVPTPRIYSTLSTRPFGYSSLKTKKKDIERFLKNIYWTHIAKRSLKDLKKSGNRTKLRNTIEMCSKTSKAIEKEVKKIHPDLIVIASSEALRHLIGRGYKESFQSQVQEIRKSRSLQTVKRLICEKKKPLFFRNP